ncbi:MAG: low molecular weight phosphotyrosine protein phosphatase [Clostridia bacterium]|nr:low molecular weight phosphotyrosine protein phosphatase [Clostridia bacterium]
MKKILFVCHGNICRSPMAEFIFRDLAQKHRMSDRFIVASCATSTEEIHGGVGNPVYPPAAAELAKHGISCRGKRAVQLTKADYGKYDLLIGMDSANIRNMHRMLGGDPDGKIHKLLEYTGSGADVSDPWYSDRFDIAWRDIYAGCTALFEKLCREEEI